MRGEKTLHDTHVHMMGGARARAVRRIKASDFFDDSPPQEETATTTPPAPAAGAVAATSGLLPMAPLPETQGRRQDAELVPPPSRRPPLQPHPEPVPDLQRARQDKGLETVNHQPDRLPDSEAGRAMNLQEQPELISTVPALSSTDPQPPTVGQTSDSLLRRSRSLHRGPVLTWKQKWWGVRGRRGTGTGQATVEEAM